jgi:hypothetical protein
MFPDRFRVASNDQVGRHRDVGPINLAGFEGFDEDSAEEAFQLTRNPYQHTVVWCKALTSFAANDESQPRYGSRAAREGGTSRVFTGARSIALNAIVNDAAVSTAHG